MHISSSWSALQVLFSVENISDAFCIRCYPLQPIQILSNPQWCGWKPVAQICLCYLYQASQNSRTDPILLQPDAFNTCYKSIFNKSIPDVAQFFSAPDKCTRYTRYSGISWIYKCFNRTGNPFNLVPFVKLLFTYEGETKGSFQIPKKHAARYQRNLCNECGCNS